MNGPTTITLVVAIAIAAVDWWAVASTRSGLERVAKPAVMAALVLAALTTDPTVSEPVRILVVVALAASLVGDVLLLPGGSLVGGLVAFAGAQLAYGASFALRDPAPPAVVAGIVVGAIVAATVGRTILAGAPRPLRPAVAGYLVVILGMAGLATGSLVPAAVVGAWLFVASDTMLGWALFVAPIGVERPRRRAAVMAIYHVAQVLLVLSIAV